MSPTVLKTTCAGNALLPGPGPVFFAGIQAANFVQWLGATKGPTAAAAAAPPPPPPPGFSGSQTIFSGMLVLTLCATLTTRW